MLTAAMTAPRTRKPAATKPAPSTEPARSLAEVGRLAAEAAQRKTLLASLRRHDWNMSATARELSMTNTANVLRAIKRLELSDDYERAKAAGKIAPGGRTA